MKQINSIKDIPEEDLFTGGSPACAGCGAALGLKLALKALGKNTLVINASGCMTLLTVYPYTPLKTNWLHLAIECAGAGATGAARAFKALKKDMKVLCFAGDGASYDIGLQSLSAAAERKEDFIYLCYNNEAYGNTGMQKTGATPYGANTTTTPLGKKNPIGKLIPKKDLPKIMADHAIYSATACISYPLDYIKKVQKAANIKGPTFIDLLTPCPTGWRFPHNKTIEIGRLAVETGMWILQEYENGKRIVNYKPKRKPVKEYLLAQKRFKHLPKKEIEKIQKEVDATWASLS
jgi:pyruvate ferredoxin oxidoreductase beta subunit